MTLIELLVAMVLALIVFAAAGQLMIVSFHSQSAASTRAQATATASTMMDRMTREIRQATTKTSTGTTTTAATIENATGTPATTGGKLVLETAVTTGSTGLSTPKQVVYDCTSSNACTRSVAGGTATTVLTGISNGTSVFSASQSTNPTFINVTLDLLLGKPFTNPLEIKDGVELRNLGP
jgi:type II secretory pathway pseudopilin PulG